MGGGGGKWVVPRSPPPMSPSGGWAVTPPHGGSVGAPAGMPAVSPLEMMGSPVRVEERGRPGAGFGSPVPSDADGSVGNTPEEGLRSSFPLPVMAQRSQEGLGPRPTSALGPVGRKRPRRSLGQDLSAAGGRAEVGAEAGAETETEAEAGAGAARLRGVEDWEGGGLEVARTRRQASLDDVTRVLMRAGSYVFGSPSGSESGSARSGSPSLAWVGLPQSIIMRQRGRLSNIGSWATIAPSEGDGARRGDVFSRRTKSSGERSAGDVGDRDSEDGGCSFVPDSQPDRDEGNSSSPGRRVVHQSLSGLLGGSPVKHASARGTALPGVNEGESEEGEDAEGMVRSSQYSQVSPRRGGGGEEWTRRQSTTLDTPEAKHSVRWFAEYPEFGLNDLFNHDIQNEERNCCSARDAAAMPACTPPQGGGDALGAIGTQESSARVHVGVDSRPAEPAPSTGEGATANREEDGHISEAGASAAVPPGYDPGNQPPISLRPEFKRMRATGGKLLTGLLPSTRPPSVRAEGAMVRAESALSLVHQIEVDVKRRYRPSGLAHGSGPISVLRASRRSAFAPPAASPNP